MTALYKTDSTYDARPRPAVHQVLERYGPLVRACWGTSLRPMRDSDIAAICEIHQRVFPDYFLTSLGKNVLDCYYRGVLQYKHGYAMIYQERGVVKGFFTGLFEPDHFYRFLLCHFGLPLTWATLPSVFRPNVAHRLYRGIWSALHTSELTGSPGKADCEMTSMGLLPEAQGRMASLLLVVSFLLEAQRQRRRKIAGGVRLAERSLLKMYQLLGFEFAGHQSKPDGRDVQLITCVL